MLCSDATFSKASLTLISSSVSWGGRPAKARRPSPALLRRSSLAVDWNLPPPRTSQLFSRIRNGPLKLKGVWDTHGARDMLN